ncbi:HAD-IA family hydrolase [Algibacillus agarilyticus]|uniref:HAD-IA family hydrolase n=1 Tax=Algibacillus agarilyticus TaxID=2234133 RepID=UPI000DCF87F6|nr:HAD-IA family hydrolase [Algibacillus agarilyticus]
MKTIFKPDAVLFDLDGTLLDTAHDLGNALNKLLKTLNLPSKAYDEYRDSASHGSYGMLKIGLGELYDSLITEDLRQQFLDHYEAEINKSTVFFNGIEQLIDLLDINKIPWGIVTNKPGYLTDQLAVQYSALKNCKVIISGDTLPERKPHPAPVLYAANKMNIQPEKCWYVGDAVRDIQAGNAAKMYTVLAEWGYTKDLLPVKDWQADVLTKTPHDLTKLIQRKLNEQAKAGK